MSITLNGLAEWIYRLRSVRIAGKAGAATMRNPGDDVTRVRVKFYDERRQVLEDESTTRLSAAHDQRDALRNHMTIL